MYKDFIKQLQIIYQSIFLQDKHCKLSCITIIHKISLNIDMKTSNYCIVILIKFFSLYLKISNEPEIMTGFIFYKEYISHHMLYRTHTESLML